MSGLPQRLSERGLAEWLLVSAAAWATKASALKSIAVLPLVNQAGGMSQSAGNECHQVAGAVL